MNSLSVCLWFDTQAEAAAHFYLTVFENAKLGPIARYTKSGAGVSGQPENSVMTVAFALEGLEVLGLNGGPLFPFNPSLSFFVSCRDENEIKRKWEKLSPGGKVRLDLDRYPWAQRYGWTTDKFGVEWQLILNPGLNQTKVVPALLFVDDLFGKGETAIQFYQSIFPNSRIETMARNEATGTVAHCAFSLNGQSLVLMEGEGKHGHRFNNATSLMVAVDTQKEIDHYTAELSRGGKLEPCGWLQDQFGVSWQIVPRALNRLMNDGAKAERVMAALLKMKKIDLAGLEAAARGEKS